MLDLIFALIDALIIAAPDADSFGTGPLVFDPLDMPVELDPAAGNAGDVLTQVAVEDAPVEPMSVEEFADRISYANDHSAL